MSKKTAFLLAGPSLPGVAALHQELADRAELLMATGLVLPAVTQAELDRAVIEIRRTHKAAGLERADVEGAWTSVCRAAEKARSDVLIGQDGYAGAAPDQIALLLDGLAAFRVHVVLTIPAGTAGLDELIDAWVPFVKAQRLHVLTLRDGEDLDDVLGEVARLAARDRAERLGRTLEKKRRLRSLQRRSSLAA